MDDREADIVIDVTPFSGDPDLFVSCTLENPTANNFTWKGQSWGEDTVLISHTDEKACHTTAQSGSVYYIGVYGYRNSTYSIAASVSSGNITLFNGIPQRTLVAQNQYRYFVIYVTDSQKDITITMTPQYGDPDMYLTVDGTRPSRHNYQASSMHSYGSDSITLLHDGEVFCTYCFIEIAVYGYRTSVFDIVSTTSNSLTNLRDGVPVRGQVSAYASKYYRFFVEESGGTLTITLTPFSGDPDLYVDMGNPHPSPEDNTWYSDYMGGDVVTIRDAASGVYYIGVTGFTNATFSIVAHVEMEDEGILQQLNEGVPQHGFVNATHIKYYQFHIGDISELLDIIATPLSGDIDLYVNECPEDVAFGSCDGLEGSTDYRPGKERPLSQSDYKSVTNIWRESIEIQKTCVRCSYIIAVVGATDFSEYSIVASVESSVITLQDGVPVRDFVQKGRYEYFMVSVLEAHRDLTISVTPFTGDPDLYVSLTPFPNTTSYTWSHRSYGTDTVTIPYASEGSCLPEEEGECRYYISVYGFVNSSFSITASLNSDLPVRLISGIPQTSFVNQTMMKQFIYRLVDHGQSVEITLSPRYGDPDLFVTTDGKKPTRTHFQYRSLHTSGDDRVLVDHTDVDNFCRSIPCDILIGVYGFRASDFSIVANSMRRSISLQDGVPQRAVVPQGDYAYFTASVDQDEQDITITVTAFSGDPDLYISTIYQYPNNTLPYYTWFSDGFGGELITIPKTHPEACSPPCNYYIAVHGFDHATFSIKASLTHEDTMDLLLSGVPQVLLLLNICNNFVLKIILFFSPSPSPQKLQHGRVNRDRWHYYQFFLGDSTKDFEIVVMTDAGGLDLYVSAIINQETGQVDRPTLERYTWSSQQSWSRQTLYLPHDTDVPYYIIGVFGKALESNFTITASSVNDTQTLRNGESQRGFLIEQSYRF